MNPVYFEFLKTVAAFIVKAVRIDKDRDGKVSGAEIVGFLTTEVTALVFKMAVLREQAQAFFDHVRGMTFHQFLDDLLIVVQMQVLPNELAEVEKHVDSIAGATHKILSGGDEMRTALIAAFGPKALAPPSSLATGGGIVPNTGKKEPERNTK